jgi:hypothetical protein
MRTYQSLIKEALKMNLQRVNTIYAFQPIIHKVNSLVEEYEKEDGIDYVNVAYPNSGNDYLLIVFYLSEKGKIMKDIGSFIDDLKFILPGLEYEGDVETDATHQTKIWNLVHNKITYCCDGARNPKITIKADASKSTTCKRVPTGEMIPLYEFICEET